MPKQWIINPEVDMVGVLSQYGRFLETDYRMAIEAMEIPREFEEYTEKSGRKFVIIGAKSVPGATAKSVFLCLKLAGPESVTIKAPTLDEYFLIENVIEHYGKDVRTKVFNTASDELKLSEEWRTALEEATDVVVFGGQDTVDAFIGLESEHRTVHVHGPKFSFGVIRAEDLTPVTINEICFDFFSFYGEGCLSPKFYIIVGRVSEKQWKEISDIMTVMYGEMVDQFRGKLPLTRKSELVQQFISANYVQKYIRREELISPEIFTTLYGDARFCVVDYLDEIEEFIEKWHSSISTVACLREDDRINDILEDLMVTRICDLGYMQFPQFFEQFDTVDDFDIYVGDTSG